MIQDWRSKFHQFTNGASDADFPFGWVQLNSDGSPNGNYDNATKFAPGDTTYGQFAEWAPGFPSLRLAQSATKVRFRTDLCTPALVWKTLLCSQ